MSELIELAAKCEAAAGPDRALDSAIWYAVVERIEPGERRDRDMVGRWPAYSASIDAAMTLVPEGMLYALANAHVDDPRGEHSVGKGSAIVGPPMMRDGEPTQAATAALALCAAALKARAARTQPGDEQL